MSPIRDTHDPPGGAPVTFKVWLLAVILPALALGGWLVFPGSTVSVVALVIVVALAVGYGLLLVIRDQEH